MKENDADYVVLVIKKWIENEWDFISGWNACLEEINATEKVINAKNVALKGEKE